MLARFSVCDLDKGLSSDRPDAPNVTATQDVPARQVVRNHVLFGIAIAAVLAVVLAITGIL